MLSRICYHIWWRWALRGKTLCEPCPAASSSASTVAHIVRTSFRPTTNPEVLGSPRAPVGSQHDQYGQYWHCPCQSRTHHPSELLHPLLHHEIDMVSAREGWR